MNWKELKDFANTLTDEQLEQPVHVWGEYFSKKITSVQVLSEDYINPSGDGVEPLSAYLHGGEHYEPDGTDGVSEAVVAAKGEIWFEAE